MRDPEVNVGVKSPDTPYNDRRYLPSWREIFRNHNNPPRARRPWQRGTRRVFVPFTRGALLDEELYCAPRRCASSCGSSPPLPSLPPPSLFRRLVNRNNCVQKLRARETLIVTPQANRIDTLAPPSPGLYLPGLVRAAALPCPAGLLSDFSPGRARARRSPLYRDIHAGRTPVVGGGGGDGGDARSEKHGFGTAAR